MTKSIKALYEDGVFKPLCKVRFKNRQRVDLTVKSSRRQTKPTASSRRNGRLVARKQTASESAALIVGLFKSKLRDLSKSHDKYLYS